MDNKETYYLFFDYDGTVFTNGTFAEETVRAMCEAKEKGHKLILNTGRSRGGLDLSKSQMAGICWDGTIFGADDIQYNGHQFPTHPLSGKYLPRFLRFAMKNRVQIVFECEKKNTGFDFRQHPERFGILERIKLLRQAKLCLLDNPLTKLTFLGLSDQTKSFPKAPVYFVNMDAYLEIYQIGKDKGSVIKEFCKLTGAELSKCVCFGDSLNDLGMFRVAPISVAMQHSPQEIKELASYTAKSDFGVAEGIYWLLDKIQLDKPHKTVYNNERLENMGV